MSQLDLSIEGITRPRIVHNPSVEQLYAHALESHDGSVIADSGALVAFSGERTGRSPGDKRLVREPDSQDEVWWGPVNQALSPASFTQIQAQAIEYLNGVSRVYVVDGYAGADRASRVAIRVICERPYHALFMRNMLILPETLNDPGFEQPDYTIINAGRCRADTRIEGVETETSVALSLAEGALVILGTEYAGEMKKGVFTLMNYLMPKRDILPMHCSANAGEQGDVALFFGLSGTGKTTLSADPARALIGDDEHCWGEAGVSNIEGGCYAKVIDLSEQAEPQIYRAIRHGAILENVAIDAATGVVDYTSDRLTSNTRCAYPLAHIDNARIPGRGPAPSQIILLTCDAFSVLPPVSQLTAEQAMYHFISGYTAKVAGTEMGVSEPEATFSACFGAPFLVWHPTVYARLLAERINTTRAQVWLVNTGWIGGPYGVGQRMALADTRAIIDAIHDGSLAQVPTRTDPVFGVAVPTQCAGVDAALLDPAHAWTDRRAYAEAAIDLAERFRRNFSGYADVAEPAITNAGPASAEAIRAHFEHTQASVLA